MIEVYFHSIRGDAGRDKWSPMISVSLDIPSQIAGGTITVPHVIAMIDTGSDSCRIDDDLAHQYNMPIIGQVTSYGVGTPVRSNIYRCTIVFDRSVELQVDFAGYPFQREGNYFSLLLGMQALQFFDFSMSAAEQKGALRPRN